MPRGGRPREFLCGPQWSHTGLFVRPVARVAGSFHDRDLDSRIPVAVQNLSFIEKNELTLLDSYLIAKTIGSAHHAQFYEDMHLRIPSIRPDAERFRGLLCLTE